MKEVYDVVVIGAGLYGIQAARTYLEFHPLARLIIVESDDMVGGVWSSSEQAQWFLYINAIRPLRKDAANYPFQERVYSSFVSQTPVSMSQFSDVPLNLSFEELRKHDPFCHASHIAEYLESYVHSHVYNNVSLHGRIVYDTRVHRVSRASSSPEEGNWTISCSDKLMEHEREFDLHANILIDCTGLASQPLTPKIPGQDIFTGLQIHQKDFARHESRICTPPSSEKIRHVAVIGGAKSAADVVYALAKHEHLHVSWIIRRDGNGPAALLPSKGAENFYTRLVAGFLPCVFGNAGWWEALVHRTRLGRWIVGRVWAIVDTKYRREACFNRQDGSENGFHGLESETPVFWQNDSSGINQRDDFWDLVATKVNIYRQKINSMNPETISLEPENDAPGLQLDVDTIIYCTGWSVVSHIYDAATATKTGLPTSSEQENASWLDLDAVADHDVLDRFPMLADPPEYRRIIPMHSPFRLYNTMVPLSSEDDRTILFLGRLVIGNNFLVAEVQALWAVAFLDGRMKCSQSEMERAVAQTVAWSRRRYLNKGQSGVWCYFDVVTYVDSLLDQIGLSCHQPTWWIRRLFTPLRASTFKYLIAEYRRLAVNPSSEDSVKISVVK